MEKHCMREEDDTANFQTKSSCWSVQLGDQQIIAKGQKGSWISLVSCEMRRVDKKHWSAIHYEVLHLTHLFQPSQNKVESLNSFSSPLLLQDILSKKQGRLTSTGNFLPLMLCSEPAEPLVLPQWNSTFSALKRPGRPAPLTK